MPGCLASIGGGRNLDDSDFFRARLSLRLGQWSYCLDLHGDEASQLKRNKHLEVVVVRSKDQIGPVVADAIGTLLASKPDAVLGLATGTSPLPVYEELICRHRAGTLSMEQCSAFLLDEYLGLDREHPELYRGYMRDVFTDKVCLSPGRLFGPDVHAADVSVACQSYEQLIRDHGGIDLQVLGIGSNGHIGFNEPMSSLGSRTRIKTLTVQTRVDNARFFGGDVDSVPRHVVTQGIGTILDARHLVLVAFGVGKATCVAQALEGPVTAMVPASALQLHPHVTVVLDEAAAGQLTLLAYHKYTYAHKPDGQGL
jgi:glucosamine-6-phosphate deaminase